MSFMPCTLYAYTCPCEMCAAGAFTCPHALYAFVLLRPFVYYMICMPLCITQPSNQLINF